MPFARFKILQFTKKFIIFWNFVTVDILFIHMIVLIFKNLCIMHAFSSWKLLYVDNLLGI
jgi:hypothetical protein